MSAGVGYLRSSIGQKQLMGVTGLVWCGFLLTHMAGNLLLFVGAEAYNKYAHALVSNPFLVAAEAFLALSLVAHIIRGVAVTIRNRTARPIAPAVQLSGDKNSSFAVKTMIYQGVVITVFLIYHLVTFKYGTHYSVTYGTVEMRDIYKLVVEVFQSPAYVVFYFACMIVVGLHLSHGFYSAFQTLGIHHPSYNPKLKCLGHIYAGLVSVGFMAQPIYIFLYAKA